MKRCLTHIFTHRRTAADIPENGSSIEGRETGMALIVAAVVLFLVLLSLLFSACTDADLPATSHTPLPISFAPSATTPAASAAGSPAAGSSTRTAPGTLSLDGLGSPVEQSLREKGFGVFACHTGLHPYVSTAITQNFMWNQHIAYSSAAANWDYSPVVYWPDPVEGLYPYVTFFAYAPYAAAPGSGSTPVDRCIVDCTLPVESGDPWLVYQLGGTEDDWQQHQVDLLYDFRPDCQQSATPARVEFAFRHALACAGDHITVTCSPALQARLQAAYSGTPVTLSVQRIALSYTLLRKGRLHLGSTTEPRWQTIASESPTVVRHLTLTPHRVIATATSATACTLTDYTAADQGIFYIPLADSANPQWVDITVDYATSGGTSASVTTRVELTAVASASQNRDFRIILPDNVNL